MELSASKPEQSEQIFSIIFDKDEITWQTIIYELINKGEIDPWDVDISVLTKRYIDMIKQLKVLDLRVSGKVLLAAALLLKIKSNRLMGADLDNLDKLFSQTEEEPSLFEEQVLRQSEEKFDLIPKTPQTRKRKVTIYDLVGALERALDVKKRRVMASIPPTNVGIPVKTKDISQVIKEVYGRIRLFFSTGAKGRLTFSQLLSDDSKEGKVYTFIPLLHLTNQRKIDLEQYQHFGDIEILMLEKEIEKELR
ncbi:MAG TPA: ScpA family protein [Candidatus Nanoarchaeia archaeon]|nr:ScpA family protein [Candidatus Nanoarchaeia archaeon]